VVRYIGAWDYAPRPALYTAYERLMPRVLGAMKRVARRGQPSSRTTSEADMRTDRQS
jgi:hypothetical protein